MRSLREQWVRGARRIVVKLGSGLLTTPSNGLAVARIEALAGQVSALRKAGASVAIVSSGAIAAGMGQLGFEKRPKALDELQAAAAIGQCKLMAVYDSVFARLGLTVAQVLLTHDDLKNRVRHLNAKGTLETLLAREVVPIINENDTVSVDEIKFGDNDRLAALTATLIDADLLVILSHVEGLYERWEGESGPAKVIPLVTEIGAEIERAAGGTSRATSVGGMKSKIAAARVVTRAGIPMVIASGERDGVLAGLFAGDEIGTLFAPRAEKLPQRKRWIAFFQRVSGVLIVDAGARAALCANGKSLLARGVTSAEGDFRAGDLVSIQGPDGVEFARGLAKVAGVDLDRGGGVAVHRDDLVVL